MKSSLYDYKIVPRKYKGPLPILVMSWGLACQRIFSPSDPGVPSSKPCELALGLGFSFWFRKSWKGLSIAQPRQSYTQLNPAQHD